jgi:hypothetical protein
LFLEDEELGALAPAEDPDAAEVVVADPEGVAPPDCEELAPLPYPELVLEELEAVALAAAC